MSSPTVSLEAMILSSAIDSMENRYIIVTDVPGVFLLAYMDESIHMIIRQKC